MMGSFMIASLSMNIVISMIHGRADYTTAESHPSWPLICNCQSHAITILRSDHVIDLIIGDGTDCTIMNDCS